MLRLIAKIFSLDYEPCKSCEVLKQQLGIANTEKKELLDNILGFVNPKVVEKLPVEVEPIAPKSMIWSRRRAMIEEQERETNKIKARFTADDLERSLGLEEENA